MLGTAVLAAAALVVPSLDLAEYERFAQYYADLAAERLADERAAFEALRPGRTLTEKLGIAKTAEAVAGRVTGWPEGEIMHRGLRVPWPPKAEDIPPWARAPETVAAQPPPGKPPEVPARPEFAISRPPARTWLDYLGRFVSEDIDERQRAALEVMPYGSLGSLYENMEVIRAAQRIAAGRGTPADEMVLINHNDRQAAERGAEHDWTYEVISIAAQMPSFWAEYGTTFGAGAAARRRRRRRPRCTSRRNRRSSRSMTCRTR